MKKILLASVAAGLLLSGPAHARSVTWIDTLDKACMPEGARIVGTGQYVNRDMLFTGHDGGLPFESFGWFRGVGTAIGLETGATYTVKTWQISLEDDGSGEVPGVRAFVRHWKFWGDGPLDRLIVQSRTYQLDTQDHTQVDCGG